MKTILASFLIILLLLPVSAIGEIKTVTHSVKQPFGGSQSPDDARITAVAKAKLEVLEMAGTYIENLTVVKNNQIDKDEILALTAGVLKAAIVSQKNYASEDAFGIEVVVKVVVDTSILEERVKKFLQDRTHLAQLKETQKREKELLQKVVKLEEENRKLTAKKQSSEKLKKQFRQASQSLTATQWFYRALAIRDEEKYNGPKKAIQYLNNAIKLEPDYVEAHLLRGLTYGYKLGQYQRAIKDYNDVIRLKPDYADAYYIRGLTYTCIDQYQRAIQDYNEAIRLKRDYAEAYFWRGFDYVHYLGQYQSGIEDYNEAIRLKPDDAKGYYQRGHAYRKLGQNQRAIQDYDDAIRLKPVDADAYYERGLAYGRLGQHQRAIQDYDAAIRLKRDYAEAYFWRGMAYGELGQDKRGIEDFNEAIRLKPDYGSAYASRAYYYLTAGDKYQFCRDAQKACKLGDCMPWENADKEGICR